MKRKIVVVSLVLTAFIFAQQRDSIVRVGACATPGSADGVFTQGQYAYIADRGRFTSIDISVPENPFVSDFSSLEWPTGVYVVDTLAFLNAALAGPAFAIFNISNPNNLIRISYIIVPIYGGSEPKGICVSDSLVYFADGSAGFLIINISDLLDPTILCTLDTPGRVIDLCVRDTLAYLADDDSLLIVNVSNPSNPAIIGHISTPGSGAYDVWVTGDYAFVIEEDFFGGQGKVNMIDVSNPTSPVLVRQVSMAATPYGLFVLNDKVYVAADDWWSPGRKKGEDRADIEGGIRVVYWEAPDSMDLRLSFDTPGRCRDIFVVDSFIYIAAWDSFMIYKYITTGIAGRDNKFASLQSLIAFPNPFNNQTQISFTIPTRSFVSIEIYDALGRRVRDLAGGYFIPGHYNVIWNGKDHNGLQIASGVYYAKLSTKSGIIRSEKQEKIIYMNKRRPR